MNNVMPITCNDMVTSPHYLASLTGSSVLSLGGNAVDAAIAVSAALGVVYPHMTGIGGDAFFMIYKDGQIMGYNGSGRAGKLACTGFYKDRGLSAIPQRGILSAITVPGMVDAWWEVWSRYGRLPWADLLQPAIEYAEQGFPISRDLHHWMKVDEQWLRDNEAMSRIYMPQGKLLGLGERLIQIELAASLKAIQREGRQSFYEGAFMEELAAAVEKDGGLLRADDFRAHRGEWVTPLTVNYRGWDIYEMPPNSQGFSLLMMMNILENVKVEEIPRQSAMFYHLAVEAIKKSFADRDRYLTDPAFTSIPLERLLSKGYAKDLYKSIAANPIHSKPHVSAVMGQDTAYAAVVDKEGLGVSFIQSLYFDFGACYMPGETGVIMQNRGSFFSLEENQINALSPGKRSFHTLMPAIICKDGQLRALLGTQGGEGQPQTQLSLMTGLLDYRLSIAEAISLPRWVYGRTWGEDSDLLQLENRGEDSEVAAKKLLSWGHEVRLVHSWDRKMGQAQGIVIDETGVRSGAADPRGDGMAIGS